MYTMLNFNCAGIDNNFMETNLKKNKHNIFSIMCTCLILIPALYDCSGLLRILFHCYIHEPQCIQSSIYEKIFTTTEFLTVFFHSSQPSCVFYFSPA